MECRKVPPSGIPLAVVDISGLRGKGLMNWLALPFRLLRAIVQAVAVLNADRPACAISFGGYAAGPGGLAARLRGIPLLVHEQNRIPGMTNRVLAKIAARVVQAFPDTWPDRMHPRTCGNPVRADVAALAGPAERMRGREGELRILLTGGSQGARALNRLLPAALALLPESLRCTVWHQAGERWREETEAAYRTAGVQARVSEFIEDMAQAYAWADLVVCRAGALTVSELAAAGVAAVLVPFPHAVDDHQTRNAEFLVEAGAALVLPEQGLTTKRLAETLEPLLADRARLLDMAARARAVAVPDSAARVADLCTEYLRP
jgi:UDP-N-acetylglucosamine--N-acetylmuramyl-(pentapeptide) pyrophosphoryl-undecaprenol N-acetylglucosamine transferase